MRVLVCNSRRELIGLCHPAQARILRRLGHATVLCSDPFTIVLEPHVAVALAVDWPLDARGENSDVGEEASSHDHT
jgi:hypothetical protein